MGSVFTVGAVVLILALIVLKALTPSEGRRRSVYVRRRFFFTENERKFFRLLKGEAKEAYSVLAKVRIADLVDVKGLSGKDWWTAFSQIAQKHVDFVLVDRRTLEPVMVIELDDPTHNRPDRAERDRFVQHLFVDTGIPLVRFTLDYDSRSIREALDAVKLRLEFGPAPNVPLDGSVRVVKN